MQKDGLLTIFNRTVTGMLLGMLGAYLPTLFDFPSSDFLISIGLLFLGKKMAPKKKEKNGRQKCIQSNSQSKFSKLDVCVFLAHVYSVKWEKCQDVGVTKD